MVAAVSVTVSAIDDIPAGNLQVVLGSIYGKAQWAADEVGQAKGTAEWAAQKVGALHYHLQQVGTQVGYTVPDVDDL